MQTDLLLNNLTESLLHEIGKFGLSCATNRYYQQACTRFKAFAAARGVSSFSEGLLEAFLGDIEEKYKTGAVCKSKRQFLRRTSLLLRDYAANEAIGWKPYVFKGQPVPKSHELLSLCSSFVDHLRFSGKSENTIQSAKNSVRQFLLFLEDGGCSTLSMATPAMVPPFFQHLLATYRTTSIGTVASNIRSFLRFINGGEKLIVAVPPRCVRQKTIIPILSDKERDALKNVLKTPKVPLRDKAIILLAFRTGLRAVDIVRMTLSDIDWINDSISITQAKTRIAFKIPLTADVGNALSNYILDERPKTDNACVFLSLVAPFRPLSGHSACYVLVRRVFHHAGIRLGSERKGIHVMRHSLASRLLSKGVAVTTISSVLGHSNKSSTDVYLQTDEARLRECALGITGIPLKCRGLV
jgi:site-specific recombinase XerD